MTYTNLDTNGNEIESDVLAFSPRKISATGAGDVMVKMSAGVVAYVHCETAGLSVYLKDGDRQVWPALTGVDEDDFKACPLQLGTSIVLNFDGAGVAYIAYR